MVGDAKGICGVDVIRLFIMTNENEVIGTVIAEASSTFVAEIFDTSTSFRTARYITLTAFYEPIGFVR